VVDELGNLAILPTFGAGTLLAESRMQKIPFTPIVIGESGGAIQEAAQDDEAHLRTGAKRPLSRSSYSSSLLDGHAPAPTSPLSGVSAPRQHPFSPFPHSRSMITFLKDEFGLSSPPASLYDDSKSPPPPESQGTSNSDIKIAGTGKTLHPLFCVSVFEHAWLCAGYGVWGKEEYMRRFWDVVDWKKANSRYLYHTKQNPDFV
jgi:Fe-Mn family superoxide dismutase